MYVWPYVLGVRRQGIGEGRGLVEQEPDTRVMKETTSGRKHVK